MSGGRHHKKRDVRSGASAIAVESLEGRVVLSAAAAHVEIQYLRAISQLNSVFQGHLNQLNTKLTGQVARLDAQYGGRA